ncbi:hypothetical protein LTR16_005424 [Cryomyces antarcticus]|uniref:Uncharacterized protein n=1 Tax=Cryomyces antarcticus TaxID=329879 RepID=A0ABR0KRC4_9PEZI|nr:hypothetical protein LTR60_002625 [Cryomyces antarcticus]KAK5111740.1 hypothetical protein LTR16_005424 [Cryomyces antarcticus]
MPFRERMKKVFKSGSSSDSTSTLSKTDSRQNSNVYQPGEPMPRPKYRAPVKKEHKEKLEAFSFGNAWRRKSDNSQYSPMGSRIPSRKNSIMSFGRKSIGQRSMSRMSRGAIPPTRLSVETEAEGDDDVGNVGLSRVASNEKTALSRQITADRPIDVAVNGTNGHQPFTEEDLVLAMKRSHLTVPGA